MSNPHKNRIRRLNPQAGRGELDLDSFSASRNRRVEQACADPDYSKWKRSLSGSPPGDANDPNTTPPSGALWDLTGFWGLHGYLRFTGGTLPSATVELWCHDPSNNRYFLVAQRFNVRESEEFHFDGMIRGRHSFLRVKDVSVDVTALSLIASVE